MTATDELRRMLDERGIEYETDDAQVSETEWYYVTKLRDGYRDRWTYEEPPDCDLLVSYQYDLGAKDAIAATVGSDERESYDAGFASGVKATLQQLYGLLHEYPTLDEIEAWADSQWEEYE